MSDSQTTDERLVNEIEALSRSQFRASVNAERRATLAIGDLILAWGQLDSGLGSYLEWIRAGCAERGLGASFTKHPVGQKQHLQELRAGMNLLSDNPQFLRDFDRLETTIIAANSVRNDIAHGAYGLSSPDGSSERLRVVCVPYRKPKGKSAPALELVFHTVSEIFQLADQIRDDRAELENLVRAACASRRQ